MRRPGYKDISKNWDDPTADAVLGVDSNASVKQEGDLVPEDLQYLTPRMFEILSTLAETGSASKTAFIQGISRDRVYITKAAAAKRIMRLRGKGQ